VAVADASEQLEMEMLFAHTPLYPEEGPSIRLRSVTGLSDADIAAATAVAQQQIEVGGGTAADRGGRRHSSR
jgi:hypothetical protein